MTGRTTVVLIADDLTGANASGGMLRGVGLQTMSLLARDRLGDHLGRFEAIAVDAGTRECEAAEAHDRVRSLVSVATAAGVRLVGKRIDSTLRGNVGSEIDGALDGRGPDAFALVVAAVPALGRVTIGGQLFVDGVSLTESLAGADPWSPPLTSVVVDVIRAQSRHRPERLDGAIVEAGSGAVQRRIGELRGVGCRIIVADAATEEHILTLARAAVALPVLPVDPGPFSAALARTAGLGKTRPPVLAVIGSVTDRTRVQLDHLLRDDGARLVHVDGRGLCGRAAGEVVDAALATLESFADAAVLVVTSMPASESVLDLQALACATGLTPQQSADRIAAGLAEVAASFLDRGNPVRGLYMTGGAVTKAVAGRLGAEAIDIEGEVLPLAVAGRLRGGPHAGLPIVSKGGLIGYERAAAECVAALAAC